MNTKVNLILAMVSAALVISVVTLIISGHRQPIVHNHNNVTVLPPAPQENTGKSTLEWVGKLFTGWFS